MGLDRETSAEIVDGKRSLWKRLFSRRSALLGGAPANSSGRATDWDNFFQFTQIHQSLRSALESLVGSWPSGVDPAIFGGSPGKQLVQRLHAFVSGPYPCALLENASPEYRSVNGKIGRGSNPAKDLLICTVIPKSRIAGKEPPAAVWSLIEEYSKLPLARLLFTLPYMHLISAAKEGKTAVLVVKDGDTEMYRGLDMSQILLIQLYKGIENAMFGVYDDLPEGGYLTQEAIAKKIRSLLPS